jgi:hypothetical protein
MSPVVTPSLQADGFDLEEFLEIRDTHLAADSGLRITAERLAPLGEPSSLALDPHPQRLSLSRTDMRKALNRLSVSGLLAVRRHK